MLFASLVLSVGLLLSTNLVARKSARPTWTVLWIGLGFAFGPILLMFFMPMAIQALLLVVAAIVCQQSQGRRSFLRWSTAATLLAYAASTAWVAHEFSEMREGYAYVSMEARVPVPMSRVQSEISGETLQGLEMLEGAIVKESNRTVRGQFRVHYLQQLHENAVLVFVNQPGFGVARMPLPLPSKAFLSYGLRLDSTPVPQPVSNLPEVRSPGESDTLLPARDEKRFFRDDFLTMHRDSVLDFVNPAGFGYLKDRQHVAGFESHQFSRLPAQANSLTVQTLHLVGLLLHNPPVAYVSANLPRMDELREVPTRPLDEFESLGLEALRRGGELYVRDTAAGSKRMLGAVRSAKQCVNCHGGERGDLLGAFSYTLEPGR